MEPYNPEKSWLEFKFNKEQAKEQLKQTIPGLRALMNIYENPESSALETLDLAAEDFVPFYAATKYGADPSDFAKEAMLLGLIGHPTIASKAKRSVVRNKDREYYNSNQNLYYKDKDGNLQSISKEYGPEPDLDNVRKYNSYKDVLEDMAYTEEALKEARPLGERGSVINSGLEAYKAIDDFTQTHPYMKVEYGGGHSSDPAVLVYNPNTLNYDVYYKFGNDWKLQDWKLDKEFIDKQWYKNDPIERANLDAAKKQLMQDIKLFNVRSNIEPEFPRMDYEYPWTWEYGD